MNSKSGKISHQQLLSEAKEELKTAQTYVQCVTITEQNWKALIGVIQLQIQALEDIQNRLTNLITKEELVVEMKDHLDTLTTQAENMTDSTEQFNADLENCMEQMEESAQKLLENTEKQAGRMSEQFSQALSQEKQRLRKYTTKLILISLIPSVILIAWELIRHFFLAI